MDEDWADWNQATFMPLSEIDAGLAHRLLGRLVDRFLTVAGLSASHREEARQQASIEVGQTPRGVRILKATLPLGEGSAESEWDGTAVAAEGFVDSIADVAGENVVIDRFIVGPTGWEPQFDKG